MNTEEKQDVKPYHTWSLVVCPVCKREFVAYPDHAYKKCLKNGLKQRMCSWHCLREYERQKQEQKKRGKKQDGAT